ncbi:FAD-dependent oxidoreductase [Flavobacterium amniphilum]|uniref:FAD-dependent oxidoreductase n=1 Tax=Flavobacterium amniphilum TaxID=1834035 RepID=UPI002029D279|nr:NAD(P)/FAD-dependent oxidoreductase [Flavobacterium amniphilum]MCL9807147.1 FAD-dependent oxidoreductase [Flavobacterium amniphilum]
MKNGVSYNSFTRRTFLKSLSVLAVFALVPTVITACKNEVLKWIFKVTGANHILGHRLWTKDFPKPSETVNVPVLIIGGGVTGLSAARQLVKKGFQDFFILELEKKIGGNSAHGENKLSKFPLAAHYLPLPNPDDVELISFLKESGVITHFENDLPVFDEEQLCFQPQERLFIRNAWQEGLVPKYGNSVESAKETEHFFKLMEVIRGEKGSDGKYFFDIPLRQCSDDAKYRYLDSITMKKWMLDQSFQSEELFEYVNYCCRDDFGFGIETVSAWAGIFYFTARKNQVYQKDVVLTWPEGNGRLVKHLSESFKEKIKKQQIAFDVKHVNNTVEVLCFDEIQNKTIKYVAKKVICATPQYVNGYLFTGRGKFGKGFQYAPWFTATITLDYNFNPDNHPLSWDNVIYKSEGLGYVYNQHQSLGQEVMMKVITYYYSFSSGDTAKSRKLLYKMSQHDFEKKIIEDLSIAHPDIASCIKSVEVYKIGHGMVSPGVGFMFGKAKINAQESLNNNVFFAHTDLSGISIFEEAFHQGIAVANRVLNEEVLDS